MFPSASAPTAFRPITYSPDWVVRNPFVLVVRSPARVYWTLAGRPLVNGSLAGGVPSPTRRKPAPSIATSNGLFVFWNEPSVISLTVALTCTPSPICTGLVPPLALVGPEAPRITCVSWFANVTLEALKPTVFTFARSLAVSFSIAWFASRPLIAAYIPAIIVTALPFAASSVRSSRSRVLPLLSCDHGTVDVGEHVVLHVFGSHGRYDRAVADGHHECGAVDKNEGVARALARGVSDSI